MQRRSFLQGLAASLAAAVSLPEIADALSRYLGDLRGDLATRADEAGYWGRVLDEFHLNPGRVHFNCGSIGITPRAVVEAHKAYLDLMETDPYAYAWSGFEDAGSEAVLDKAQAFLHAERRDEMLLTRNTTEAMNLIATGLRWQPGDEVLTTDHEHPGGIICWLHMEQMADIRVRQIHLPTPVTDKAEILQRLEDGLTDRTRVVSVSHVTTTTGLRMPLADIAAITRPRGILLVADGAQVPGMLDVDVQALGVDAYASSSHKWMLAPKGTGLLYVRNEVADQIRPISASTGTGSHHGVYMAGGGTRNTPLMVAHGDTMDFHDLIGRTRVEARVLQLHRYLRDQLRPLAALLPMTPEDPELSCAMSSYVPMGVPVRQVYDQLHDWGISIKRTAFNSVYGDNDIPRENHPVIRLSTHIFNDEAQIDRLVKALTQVVGTGTAVGVDAGSRPRAFEPGYTYPNPFNAQTHIAYELPAGSQVEVTVRNAAGQVVEVLQHGWQDAGAHQLTWDAAGHGSGTYFCEVRAGVERVVRKMVLLE